MYHDNTFRDFKCATMVSTSHIPKLLLLFIENKGEARGTLGSWPPFHARVLHPTFSRFCSNLPHQCQVPRAMHVSQQNLFAYTCVCVCVCEKHTLYQPHLRKTLTFPTHLFTLVEWTILRSSLVHFARVTQHQEKNNSSKIPDTWNATHQLMLWYLYNVSDFTILK